MKLLVSVRNVAEARLAAAAGVELIDLKEPDHGALGAVPIDVIRSVVEVLRQRHPQASISATVGDHASGELAAIIARVQATAATGVDWVKVGIDRASGSLAEAVGLIETLGTCGLPVVPVFLADRGLEPALWQAAARQRFAAWMLDTANKRSGSLLDQLHNDELTAFIARAKAAGALAGLAGSLRLADLPRLQALAPQVTGFRGAVCTGDRRGALDPLHLRQLRQLHQVQCTAAAPELMRSSLAA